MKATETLMRKLVYVKIIFCMFSSLIEANVIDVLYFEQNTYNESLSTFNKKNFRQNEKLGKIFDHLCP